MVNVKLVKVLMGSDLGYCTKGYQTFGKVCAWCREEPEI